MANDDEWAGIRAPQQQDPTELPPLPRPRPTPGMPDDEWAGIRTGLVPPPRNPFAPPEGTLQTIDDAVREGANVLSFGMADRLAGAMPGTSTDEQVALSEAARKRSPIATTVGGIAGAFANPEVGGASLAARLGGGFVARGLGHGYEGAVLGGLQGAGNTYTGNPLDYATNAGKNAIMGGVFGGVLGSLFGPRGGLSSTAPRPTAAELYREKGANYDALANLPAAYDSAALWNAANTAEGVVRRRRFIPEDSPKTFRGLDEMRTTPTTSLPWVTPADIEHMHQGLNKAETPTDIASSGVVKRALNDFVLNPPPGAVIPGTEAAAAEASALAARARGNYAGYKRTQAVEDLISNAQDRSMSANSGLNLENTLRQDVRGLIRQKEGRSQASELGFTPEEIERFRYFDRNAGSPWANVQRYVGNVMGGGGGVAVPIVAGLAGSAVGYNKESPGAGAAIAGMPVALGLALRMAGNRRATANINELRNMAAERTPLFQERAATAPMAPPGGSAVPEAIRNAITYEMMRQGQPEEESQPENGAPTRITVRPTY